MYRQAPLGKPREKVLPGRQAQVVDASVAVPGIVGRQVLALVLLRHHLQHLADSLMAELGEQLARYDESSRALLMRPAVAPGQIEGCRPPVHLRNPAVRTLPATLSLILIADLLQHLHCQFRLPGVRTQRVQQAVRRSARVQPTDKQYFRHLPSQ